MMQQAHLPPKRFYSLDALRGIAALCVVFWHWQHFFFAGTTAGKFDLERLPFSDGLSLLYTKGWLAVDLFFSLSGFIFYWLYSKKIALKEISSSQFSLLRFSRLYPLHLASLLMVAIGQLWVNHARGAYFVYPYNDVKHFLLNILFTSSWGFEQGHSFNAPIWSVSVEVLLYIIFFSCCRLLPVRAFILAAISIMGFQLIQDYYQPIGRGLGSFFLGGLVFIAYQTVLKSKHSVSLSKSVFLIMLFAWSITITTLLQKIDFNSLSIFHFHLPHRMLELIDSWPVVVLFPLSILSLALFETQHGPLAKRIAFLGDISYSSYLLHFPLQLLFSMLLSYFSFGQDIYYSPWLMLLFFTLLITISFISFRNFEMPAQKRLRQLNISRKKTVQSPI
ncbi:MAG: acyltransferase [Proteobacteria bacterium]|nr:acyltransferase [Pseudomonadota bacterium]